MTQPQRRWMVRAIPTAGADAEEVDVDAATERDAPEKAHAEAITLYGSESKILSMEQRMK